MDCVGGLCVVVVVVLLDVVETPVKSSGLVVSSDIKDGVQGLPMLISICQSFLTNRVEPSLFPTSGSQQTKPGIE